ncbi:TIGR02452 family protein [Anaerostipes sp.]|uniref:TIGR02452 family protein n=1 Tax=Anaerostipes sp. TaxID=1872530 RepID=UPI003526E070
MMSIGNAYRPPIGQHIPSLDVVNIDSVSAIFRYAEAGKKTVVLNLANYKKAGGMFIQGSRSKEEEYLCHDSYLYNVLTAFPEYYDWNRQHTNRSLYLNRALYSPDIYFFQDGHKVLCDVITWCSSKPGSCFEISWGF